jgi:hypothetical protein
MKIEKDWSPVALKPLLDHLKELPETAYEELRPYIELVAKKRKSIILEPGQIELYSRLIVKGKVAKYLHGKLIRLYVEGDMCMDMESYSQQIASRFELRVIQDCSFSTLSYNNANLILNRYPRFAEISEELYRLARHKEEEWMAICRLPYDEARSILNKKYPGFEATISQVSLASLLGVNVKTISRDNERQLKANKRRLIVDRLREYLKYPFESKVHGDIKKLEVHTLAWTSLIHKIYWDAREGELNSLVQYTWLPARLYPDAEWKNVYWISRFYVLLFAMDDYTDLVPDGMKSIVWEEINDGISEIINGRKPQLGAIRIQVFFGAFSELWKTLGDLPQANEGYISMFKGEVEKYLSSNLWEAGNRDNQTIPEIEKYKQERPCFSGGNLSIALIP